MTDMRDDWGDDGGLGPRLDAFAAARLRADPERTRVVRARVLAEAGRAAAVRVPGASGATPVAASPKVTGHAWFQRPARSLVLVAATLLIVLALAGGALAASGPGGATYGVRLWLEEATLPTDPGARLEAELDRLDARLREAEAAAANGNGDAVTAALEAYRAIADAAAVSAGVDTTQREHIAAELGRHVAVLQALVPQVPARAAEAIAAAVHRTEVRIEEILATPRGQPVSPGKPVNPGKPGVTPGTGPVATPEATPRKTPPGGPEATPTPEATSKPEKTPKPETTPKPDRTPPGQPERTYRPTP